ncbi:MAG: tRNA epoxyqueuosine(34) reductase QueG [Sedimentisphaerales bacterium]|nr:tRNA epoxyqueuosine(34) reductase QueG [Sedimentisphaerales bacterium]
MNLSQNIKQKAIELGFDLVGITDVSPISSEQAQILKEWLQSGYAGQMEYMHRNLSKRLNPAKLFKHARSVIVVGLNFSRLEKEQKPVHKDKPTGRVVTYAQYEDYHPFIKARLFKLVDFLNTFAGGDLKFKVCVDSAPVAERALAVRAGLGFIGKNHMLINPKLGCRMFLGEIITNLDLSPDESIIDDCADCKKCIEVCPTGALRLDGQFDAGRCINYLTIEHKGPIPPKLAKKISDRLFGCEECIRVCPYQRKAPPGMNKEFKFYCDRAELRLRKILDMSSESFDAEFGDSVIKRLGLEGLKRNAHICLDNMTGHG